MNALPLQHDPSNALDCTLARAAPTNATRRNSRKRHTLCLVTHNAAASRPPTAQRFKHESRPNPSLKQTFATADQTEQSSENDMLLVTHSAAASRPPATPHLKRESRPNPSFKQTLATCTPMRPAAWHCAALRESPAPQPPAPPCNEPTPLEHCATWAFHNQTDVAMPTQTSSECACELGLVRKYCAHAMATLLATFFRLFFESAF